jgi:hypothetical protein
MEKKSTPTRKNGRHLRVPVFPHEEDAIKANATRELVSRSRRICETPHCASTVRKLSTVGVALAPAFSVTVSCVSPVASRMLAKYLTSIFVFDA